MPIMGMAHRVQYPFKARIFAFALGILSIAYTQSILAQNTALPTKPKNIIILFADGVTGTQLEFGRNSSQLLRQQPFAATDTVMKHGSFALMGNQPADAYTTDSAAAATAMSTGYKANNGAIAITPDGESPPTIMAIAKAQGKKIGLITTATIYDASPAAFSVHAQSRRDSAHIVNQYAELLPDVLMGGGADFFLPKSESGGKRLDGKNILDRFKAKGYLVVNEVGPLTKAHSEKLLGLFSMEDMDAEIDRAATVQPSLAQMVSAALKTLSSQGKKSKGFVLFAEDENTDTDGHRNDTAALMHDLWAFDDAIKVALEFQKANPDTLIIVTGDHETGGFSPTNGPKNPGLENGNRSNSVALAQLKKINAFKASTQQFADVAAVKVREGYSQKKLEEFIVQYLQNEFPGMALDDGLKEQLTSQLSKGVVSNYSPVANILSQAIARQTGFHWGTTGHTNEPIVAAAIGPGSQLFRGYQDNTDFARKLQQLLGWSK